MIRTKQNDELISRGLLEISEIRQTIPDLSYYLKKIENQLFEETATHLKYTHISANLRMEWDGKIQKLSLATAQPRASLSAFAAMSSTDSGLEALEFLKHEETTDIW